MVLDSTWSGWSESTLDHRNEYFSKSLHACHDSQTWRTTNFASHVVATARVSCGAALVVPLRGGYLAASDPLITCISCCHGALASALFTSDFLHPADTASAHGLLRLISPLCIPQHRRLHSTFHSTASRSLGLPLKPRAPAVSPLLARIAVHRVLPETRATHIVCRGSAG